MEDIKLNDFQRILVGTAPTGFLLEVLGRTILVYIIFFLVMRMLGKRMNGQLTVTEMVLILTLGAVISVPMQAADKGLLQGIIILIVAFLIQRVVSWLGVKNSKFQRITLGRAKMLVKNGVFQMGVINETHFSQEILFSKLRGEHILNLGSVKRMYVEAAGLFSIYKEKDPKPGLSTLPFRDSDLRKKQKSTEDFISCCICGNTVKKTVSSKCHICNSDNWTNAVLE